MRFARALLVSTAVAFGASVPAAEAEDIDLGQYQMTFEENFDDLDVSEWGPGTRWIAHTPWSGDFGDAKFVAPGDHFPFTVQDGILTITMKKGDDGRWRSGLLASVDRKGVGFSQQYGYFEMRAKFPAGEGVWPAFWLVGVERLADNPAGTAEIDVVEHYGRAPAEYSSSVHVWPIAEGVKKSSVTHKTPVPRGSLSDDFHRYGVLIEAEQMRFYLDGTEVWSHPTPEFHRQPMFILLNLGLGAGWPIENAPNPAEMKVDYVRAYARP
ncbi:MAG: glycoside hydrolase family 16 protein [Aurantimonas endophytica]|uniref:Beta-glucanase (GH16 family) n=1 Tax=Aurantimonas endophytica TaxID=1522175 RepID=A0A7W6HGK8_9HYPH|nr:glycoside hydrolase family 16 protein [Aurantimonas endophytica]MBB4004793.1 beta-glucanase (GH16 family) [Aurantimonas endophytica]MCO6405603.1 family 16 glycosylhydrolase [Aurantimonas endophytica]